MWFKDLYVLLLLLFIKLEQTSDVLKDIKKKTISMKAKHGETRSERKKYRVALHEHDIQDYVSIQVVYKIEQKKYLH